MDVFKLAALKRVVYLQLVVLPPHLNTEGQVHSSTSRTVDMLDSPKPSPSRFRQSLTEKKNSVQTRNTTISMTRPMLGIL
ncbi:hypothetical protein PM082_021518 [Marasmius tenuissimus]|nr:hypothetical protein PM082_021518 [Marasmius tenuissimus]